MDKKIRYQNVLYRNRFYNAMIKDWRYLILNSKEEVIDITDKKFVVVPDWMDIVTFSTLYHNYRNFIY